MNMTKGILIFVIGVTIVFTLIFIFSQGSPKAPEVQVDSVQAEFNKLPNFVDLRLNMTKVGLDALTEEGTKLHIHQHLDIVINGKQITVPSEIGVGDNFISPVHTHDTSGIIHVESPVIKSFNLSQLFGEWGLKYTNECIASYCADSTHKLVVAVNGIPVTDTQSIVLKAHDEIEIWYGNIDEKMQLITSYDFPSDL